MNFEITILIFILYIIAMILGAIAWEFGKKIAEVIFQ